jgi:acyl carrier protein
MVREDSPGERRLCAYVLIPSGSEPTSNATSTASLRQALGRRLPDYMVPSHIVTLERWPLTPNGKIDRRALPAPDALPREARYVAPRTGTERQLARIWADVLGIDHVGLHDNFFELGGHSLLAVQILARTTEACQVALNIEVVFQFQTVELFAHYVDTVLALRSDLPDAGTQEEDEDTDSAQIRI